MDQQRPETWFATASLAITTVIGCKNGSWPCVIPVRSGNGGESNSALRRWWDGRVPGRCGRARASRRNGPGRRVPRSGRAWLRALSMAGPWLRCLAGRRRASGSSRAGAHGPGGSGSTPAPPMTGRRGGVAGCNRAGTRFRRLAAWVLVAIAASAFGTPALADSHCDATDTNELWCATMTVAVSGNNTPDSKILLLGCLAA